MDEDPSTADAGRHAAQDHDAAASAAKLDAALADLGWLDMLDEMPDQAIASGVPAARRDRHARPGAQRRRAARGRARAGGTSTLPFTGGRWVTWERTDGPHFGDRWRAAGHPVREGPLPMARWPTGRHALGWWLVGSARAMLALARQHALDRVQFGRPIASFQAVRHRLAETLVAIEGAEATLFRPRHRTERAGRLLAKAAAGQAALTTAQHCQQVLGGIGFTDEHDLHRHVKRSMSSTDCSAAHAS